MIPFIIGVVWMFATGGSFASKVFTALSVLLIIVSIIVSTRIWLVRITMYEWVLILVLIFGGAGLVAKVLFANNKSERESGKKDKDNADNFKKQADSIDDEIERMKKNMK